MRHSILSRLSLVACLGAAASSCSSSPTSSGASLPSSDPPPLERAGGTVDASKLDLLLMIDDSISMRDKQELLRDAIPRFVARIVADGTVNDVHVGVVSSSLGSAGASSCTRPEENGHAHLVDAAASKAPFLSWTRGASDPEALTADLVARIGAMTESGCGYEAQLESWYRFLVQPDPAEDIRVAAGSVTTEAGVDDTILAQRKAFLRPDSKVVITMLTDENDSNVDPLAFGGRAWFFTEPQHVKPGTSACEVDPFSDACTSCYLAAAVGDPRCTTPLTDKTDHPNVRFFDMRRRFGVDPRFPLSRYIEGLTAERVSDRTTEHPKDEHGLPSFSYVGKAKCTNPLFASALPASSQDETCNLKLGPRTRDDVLFVVIGGIPSDLVPAGSDGSPVSLDAAAWSRALTDPRMTESIGQRPGVADDRDSHSMDLQFACTFPLATPRDCSALSPTSPSGGACDCLGDTASPLCAANPANGGKPTLQVAAKAYPSLRELVVARALGDNALVGSLCPTDRGVGVGPALDAVAARLARRP
ncbi:MAG: hypothetical protein JWM74_5558 [Myxococcaceae bacterium]|nr:hypothetical protein [Myxococcaceae bacterium]